MLSSSGALAGGLLPGLVPRWACWKCVRAASTGPRRKAPLPPIARLDPARPLPTLVTRRNGESSRQTVEERAARLSRLETALQYGSADSVWEVYAGLVQEEHWGKGSIEQALTPSDCARVLEITTAHATRRRRDMHRVLTVVSDVRNRRRCIIAAARSAMKDKDETRLSLLMSELDDWDAVLSPRIMNSVIGYIGLSLRRATLSQLDDVLDQLLDVKSDRNETYLLQGGRVKLATRPLRLVQGDKQKLLGLSIPSLIARKRPQRAAFPDLTTYNTLLEIVTRMVHRRTRPSLLKPLSPDEDLDQFVSMQDELNISHADAQYSALASKLRSLDIDAEMGPVTLKWADQLFHAILHRMHHKSHLEPDKVTYNIMLSMYCQLGRRDLVHQMISTMQDKDMLTIESINNVLWKWVTWLSVSAEERSAAADDVAQVYGVLRDNVVQHEMGTAYPTADKKSHEKPSLQHNQAVKRVIRILSRLGRFNDALSVFKDLVSTPRPDSSEPFKPDLSVFDSFFRGFARHGRPSRLVHYDCDQPERSKWEAIEQDDTETENAQAELWNIDTFRQIFDTYLCFYPEDLKILSERQTLPQAEGSESLISISTTTSKRPFTSAYGAASLDAMVELRHLRRAPSSNQLFWVLTALRRVSGDNARWTLAMWQKVCDKFTNRTQRHDVFTWSNFELDNRLERVLSFLRTKDETHRADK